MKRLLVARPLIVGNVSVRPEAGQGVHADARIPKRALRSLFDFWRIQTAETRAIRPGMLAAHNVRKRLREISVLLGLLIEPGQDTVASEGHPNVVLRVGVALVSSA